MQEDKILYDWLNITSKIHNTYDFIELLGFQNVVWQEFNGAKGFRKRLYYGGVSIHYDREDSYIWLEMSGQGCRTFETFGNGDYESLFALVQENPDEMHITRLDVAFDDHTGILDIERIFDDVRNQNFVSRFKKYEARIGSDGLSVYHGSKESLIFIRIYDKAAERGFKDCRHWIRVEIKFGDERALQFINYDAPIGTKLAGVLKNYLRYVVPSETDTNKRRWEDADYYTALVGAVEPISLYVKPGVEYNYFNLENYVIRQAGNAIDAFIEIRGVSGFLSDLKDRFTVPNPKYMEVVDKYKKGILSNSVSL